MNNKECFTGQNSIAGTYRDPLKSAQPCGCDEGANHLCERHSAKIFAADLPYVAAHREKSLDVKTFTYNGVELPVDGPKRPVLPTDPATRKQYPIWTGVFEYFPDAIAAIAHISWKGNQQHNPGEPLHWARGKSMDQMDTAARHMGEHGTIDVDGERHTAKAAWRILAELQLEIEIDRIRGRAQQEGCSENQ